MADAQGNARQMREAMQMRDARQGRCARQGRANARGNTRQGVLAIYNASVIDFGDLNFA
jgi:hypothetical protein